MRRQLDPGASRTSVSPRYKDSQVCLYVPGPRARALAGAGCRCRGQLPPAGRAAAPRLQAGPAAGRGRAPQPRGQRRGEKGLRRGKTPAGGNSGGSEGGREGRAAAPQPPGAGPGRAGPGRRRPGGHRAPQQRLPGSPRGRAGQGSPRRGRLCPSAHGARGGAAPPRSPGQGVPAGGCDPRAAVLGQLWAGPVAPGEGTGLGTGWGPPWGRLGLGSCTP